MATSARPRLRLLLAVATLAALAPACQGSAHTASSVPARPSATPVPGQAAPSAAAPSPSTSPPPATTTTAPKTTTVTAAPSSFVGTVTTVTASDIPYSWRPGCPLGPDQLRMLQLSYWGFDNQPHVGSMVVNTAVTADVLKIFARLFAEHFPVHQMQPVDTYRGSDPASMSADNTSGFNCRYAVAPGRPQWSVHAFGEAIDVNTVENPYVEGGTVMPAAGAAFVDRSLYRPGMAVTGGQLVQAFASVGWQWGGRWTSPDYQHFSKTGG